MKPAVAAQRRGVSEDPMKKRSFSLTGLTRRDFLGAGSASLALLSLPGSAMRASDSRPATVEISSADPPLFLARDGRPSAALVVPPDPGVLSRMAEGAINTSLKRQTGATLESLRASRGFPHSPDRNLLVLGTPHNNPVVARCVEEQNIPLGLVGPEGYAIRTWRGPQGGCTMLVAANSEKGVYHGAAHVSDFLLASTAGSALIPAVSEESQPAIKLRGTYNLACWNLAPRYSRADWEKIIDGMAEDHMNFIYFWLAGLFRSKTFPESFIYPETPLTNDDIHALIKHAHDRGIEFYLGSGAFAWFGEDQIGMYHPDARELVDPHLCRTLPASRRIVGEYLTELYDTFAEADGMYLEMGCEGDYHCMGPLCQKPLDAFGSKQIGESEISFLREFSESLWKKNQKLKFVCPIGYPESHKWDVLYYQAIRERMTDPRYFWMEARQNWRLQNAKGALKDLGYLSKNILHWDQYYTMPLLDMRDQARRVAEAGIAGYVVAFEPGFATASVYGDRVPFPVDLIPYRLTRFAYREFTWNPQMSWSDFKARVHKKFFAPPMSDDLVDIMITLRDLMREGPLARRGSADNFRQEDVRPFAEILRPRLAAMEAEVAAERGKGSGTNWEGITLVETCIRDLRAAYHIT